MKMTHREKDNFENKTFLFFVLEKLEKKVSGRNMKAIKKNVKKEEKNKEGRDVKCEEKKQHKVHDKTRARLVQKD